MQSRTARRRTLAAVVLFASTLALAATAAPDPQLEPSADPGASALFNRHCAKCHGRDGRAKRLHGMLVGARNLTAEKWQARITDAEIRSAIEQGPGPMPAFAEKLSAAEIDSLVAYVRHFRRHE